MSLSAKEQAKEAHAISFALEKAIDQVTAIESLLVAGRDGNYPQTLDLPVTTPNPKRWIRKPRMDLPLLVDGNVVISMPDSGTEDNIISKDLVSQLRIIVDDQPENQKEFRLANNHITRAIGRVKLSFKFARDQKEEHQGWFYVFNTLLYPLLVGMAFLDATETLTLHRHRLQPRCSPFNGPLRVACLNNPKRRLYCWPKYILNTKGYPITQVERTMANADTGSEVDLISLALCRRKGMNLQPLGIREKEVQFADGSSSYLSGKVTITIRIGGRNHAQSAEFRRLFYVLQDLTCDMLLGEDFLEQTEVFEHYQDSITLFDDEDLSQVNGIFWANTPEQFLSKIGRQSAPEPLTDDNSARRPSTIPPSRWTVISSLIKRFLSRKNDRRDSNSQEDDPTFEARMDLMDAREAHRRRQEKIRIEGMACTADGSSKRFAQDKERARIEEYEQKKKLILQARAPLRSTIGDIPLNVANAEDPEDLYSA